MLGQTKRSPGWDIPNKLPIISLLCVMVGLILRVYWIITGKFSFDSDEAIVGLMAKHILQGERPLFFYGQAYMGSLDAWINAIAFEFFGQTVVVMRSVQTILWVVLLVSIYFCAQRCFQSSQAGWWAVLLFSLPPVNQVLYSTVSLGGYNEALIIGVWCIYMADRCSHLDFRKSWYWWVGLGFVTGFGLWVFGFSLLFSLSALIYLLWTLSKAKAIWHTWLKSGGLWLGGLIFGIFPIWFYLFENGVGVFIQELSGSAVNVQTGNLLTIWLTRFASYFLLGLPAGIGFRPPWSVDWLMLPLIPFVIFAWIYIIRKSAHIAHSHSIVYLFYILPILLLAVFTFSSFGVDPSGRYFLPLFLVCCLLGAGVFSNWTGTRAYLPVVLTSLFLIFQFGGTIQASILSKDGFTPQFAPDTATVDSDVIELQSKLATLGIETGFTDYWTAYPLAFLSDETQIFIPRLPYHHNLTYTLRDDRYPTYSQKVYTAANNAFITHQHPELDKHIQQKFNLLGVEWKMDESVTGYRIYYDLSSPVTPEDIGFGEVLSK